MSNTKKTPIFSLTKKDFEVTWFSGSGGGGQHRNKHKNCCRIKHVQSGVISTGQSHRSRVQNQKEAMYGFKKKPQFMSWVNMKVEEIESGKTIEQKVDEDMNPKNIIVDIQKNGKWIKEEQCRSRR